MAADSLFTWEALSTLAGASLLTFLVVGYTKRLVDRFWPWGTDLYAVCVGALVLTTAQLATGVNPADWRIYPLSLANGFLVAAAAGKLADKTLAEQDRRQIEELRRREGA